MEMPSWATEALVCCQMLVGDRASRTDVRLMAWRALDCFSEDVASGSARIHLEKEGMEVCAVTDKSDQNGS